MMGVSDGRWHPGIGDPSLAGWVTVAAYGLAMVLCFLNARRLPRCPERRFWLLMAVVMAVLGINKQLDLQSWFTEIGRDRALADGWYENRRFVQGIFVFWLAMGGIFVKVWLGVRLKNLSRYARMAGAGLLLLMVFVVMRAASFHHIDVLLGLSFGNVRINVVMELSALGIIVWFGVRHLLATDAKNSLNSYKLES